MGMIMQEGLISSVISQLNILSRLVITFHGYKKKEKKNHTSHVPFSRRYLNTLHETERKI